MFTPFAAEFEEFEMAHNFKEKFRIPPEELLLLLLSKKNLKSINVLTNLYKNILGRDMTTDEAVQLLHTPKEQLEQKIKGFKKIHAANVVYKLKHRKYISDELLSRMRRESEFFAELLPSEVSAWVEKEQYALLWGD